MSLLDDLGGAALGGLGGYLGTGDLSGLLAGGLGGGLSAGLAGTNPIMSGLIGTGAGYLGSGLSNQFGNYLDSSGYGSIGDYFNGGGLNPGGLFSGLGGSLGGLGQYLPSLGGLMGGGGGGPQFGNQGTGQGQMGTQGTGPGMGQGGQGSGLGWLGALGGLAGAGLGIAGLTGGTPNVNLTQPFQGQQQNTTDQINAALAQQNPEYQQAIQAYQQSRAQGAGALDQALNGNAQFQMQNSLRTIGDRLNSMGLMNGPSGAMDEALAQAAGQIKSQSLPYEAQYASQTQSGLDQLNQAQLQNTLGLQTGGLQRNFGLQDQMTNASLKQQLLNAQQQQSQNQGLIGAGSTLLGGALGQYGGGSWTGGAQAGSEIGGALNNVFNPNAGYGSMGGGYQPRYGTSMGMGGF